MAAKQQKTKTETRQTKHQKTWRGRSVGISVLFLVQVSFFIAIKIKPGIDCNHVLT